MILITGMPRSGTTFMQKVFHKYGAETSPPIFTRAGYDPRNLHHTSEPSSVGRLLTKGASKQAVIAAIKDLEIKQNRPGETVAIKLPQLCFYPGVCDSFDKVIVCVREVDEKYLKSGRGHNIGGWLSVSPSFLSNLEDRTLEGMSRFWYAAAMKLAGRNPAKYKLCRFGNKDNFDSILSEYWSQEIIDQAWQTLWKGTRY
jgi:hypothetical protein